MDSKTLVNSELNESPQQNTNEVRGTLVNPELQVANPSAQSIIAPGTLVADIYTIIRRLDKESGEADLYLAEGNGALYVVKVYRRENAVKEEIVDILSKTNHPNLPHIFSSGLINNRQFEIMEYYPQGSLEGTTLSEEELKKHFIPDMNAALHELDSMGIVHKDIKPSNIAKKTSGEYVLMDFGISSVRQEGRTSVSTNIGITLDYSAPESMGLGASWSTLSDYYSLGITIYELLVGTLPFVGMSDDDKADYKKRQVIPVPDSVSEDFKTLILGMTYKNTDNRHDLSNVNNRWGYEFVCDWLSGKKMAIPGSSNETVSHVPVSSSATARGGMTPFEFEDVVCNTPDEIFIAMATNWNKGMKYLAQDILYDFFKSEGMNKLAIACKDAADEGTDLAMAKLIYQNTTELDKICFKDYCMYPEELGEKLYTDLWSLMNKYEVDENGIIERKFAYFKELFDKNIIAMFYEARSKGSLREEGDTKKAEYFYSCSKYDDNLLSLSVYPLYHFAYSLTDTAILNLNGQRYTSFNDFMDEFEDKMINSNSEDEFREYLSGFIPSIKWNPDSCVLDGQLEVYQMHHRIPLGLKPNKEGGESDKSTKEEKEDKAEAVTEEMKRYREYIERKRKIVESEKGKKA